MRLRTLLTAALFFTASPIAAAEPANIAPESKTSSEVMRVIGLDRIFPQFGQTVAASPRQGGVTDARFLEAWESVAASAFSGADLAARLEATLSGSIAAAEWAKIDDFLLSPLGHRVTELERATHAIAPERHIAAIAKGQTIYLGTSPRRRDQLEELLALSGADMTFTMLGESIRGMALGLHLSVHGQLQLPWEEIDAGVASRLAGMRQSLVEATRGTFALTYGELSEAELEAYLDFLRHPATRKFYTVATLAVGAIIRETMFGLGEDVAARLRRVDI
jgi:hypothetical protein